MDDGSVKLSTGFEKDNEAEVNTESELVGTNEEELPKLYLQPIGTDFSNTEGE